MRCHQCGTENPDKNNFCGNCGVPLEPAKVAVAEPVAANARRVEPAVPVSYWEEVIPSSEPADEPEPAPVLHRHAEPTTISGPSFLGLTDSSASDESSYLLEDDQPRRGRGLLVFCLFAIAVFAGIGYLEWQTMKTGRLSIPFISKPAAEEPAKAAAPAPPQNGSAETAANKSTTPQSDNSDTNNDSLATSDNDNAKNGPVNPVPGAAASTTSDTESKPAPVSTTQSKSDELSSTDTDQHPKSTGQATAAASDQGATESAQSRQGKDTDEQGSAGEDSSADAAPTKKAKPSARAASLEKPPDPRQNHMLLLGERYLYGHGVPQNCNQALVYFKSAAEGNNAPAMAHLGAMYASGQCVTLNRVTAFNWFARAQNAQPSDPWLQRNMNMLWRDMTPQERTAVNK